MLTTVNNSAIWNWSPKDGLKPKSGKIKSWATSATKKPRPTLTKDSTKLESFDCMMSPRNFKPQINKLRCI